MKRMTKLSKTLSYKYNEPTVEKIYKYLRQGSMREDAGVLAGITHDTFRLWLKKFPEFRHGVDEAENVNKYRTLRLLQKHGKKSWQALAWWLERRFYLDFMNKTSTKIEGTGGVQIAIIGGGYIPSQLETKQPALQITEPSNLISEGSAET